MSSRRQPIVAVLGHVDHGKTSILDHIRSLGSERQSSVMDREAGGITQHIGATEVPADILNEMCAPLMGGKKFNSPGLLFIDTPGHHSFSTLRARGGSLADIAILVIDIMDGCKPQTLESMRILRQAKTPFVIACNKVDRLYGWQSEPGRAMAVSMRKQTDDVMALFDQRYWQMVGEFSGHGFNIERYDQITDFTQNIALVPCSAKEGEGIQDLLAVTIGLAERYLAEQLEDVEGAAEATVLEMKEERGLGKTLDVILHRGTLSKGDEFAIATPDGPQVTRIKGMFSPRGMSEMRDAGDRWDSVDSVTAAAGLKISAPELDSVLAGTTLRAIPDEESRESILALTAEECEISIELDEEGIAIKADTLGGLEALAFELREMEDSDGKPLGIHIRAANIGPISRRDIRSAETSSDPFERVILTFSSSVLAEAQAELDSDDCEVTHIGSDIIYHVLEEYQKWIETTKQELAEAEREVVVHPGRILLLADHVFRRSGPAVVGVRVLGGRIMVGQRLLQPDGTSVGRVKSIRDGDHILSEAKEGDELAIAIQGAVIGRGVEEEDVLLVDVPASHARKLKKVDLTPAEKEILDELIAIHRKEDHFWGR
jgi:translation initiation factor 5B